MPHSSTSSGREKPSFKQALGNKKMQTLIGGLLVIAAASATAVGVQSATGPATSAPTTKAEIEQIVRDYILEHPEILPEAMERLKAKHVKASIEENRDALETPYRGAWEGAENGDVILVEFFDYACGYCRKARTDIEKLLAEDKKLKVVYRELPILSEASNSAARVSLLAAEKGKYSAFHEALYKAGRVSQDSILAAATSVGLDRKTALSAMKDDSYRVEIEGNIKLAQALGATGTPAFVVGNQFLNGAVGYDALKQAIAQTRKEKGGE